MEDDAPGGVGVGVIYRDARLPAGKTRADIDWHRSLAKLNALIRKRTGGIAVSYTTPRAGSNLLTALYPTRSGDAEDSEHELALLVEAQRATTQDEWLVFVEE